MYQEEGSQSAESGQEEEEQTEVKEQPEKITVIKKKIPKRQKLEQEEAFDTGLSLQDDEDLALQLLLRR